VAIALPPRVTPEVPPPTPITITVTTDPPRTVTIVEPLPRVDLVPLAPATASTDGPAPVPDLDGDGVPEVFRTQPDSCGTGGCVFEVFLSRNPDEPAGIIEGKWGYWTVTPRTGSYADLTTTWFLGCCEVSEETYRFERGAYRQIRRVLCDPRATPAEVESPITAREREPCAR
jgi:hypothetical protein